MIWSHVDFDSIITNGADPELDRKVVHAYADATPAWARRAEGRMGRKLSGLLRAESAIVEDVKAFSLVSTALSAAEVAARIDDVVDTVETAIARGGCAVSSSGLAEWRSQIGAAAEAGTFLFAETTFVVVARR